MKTYAQAIAMLRDDGQRRSLRRLSEDEARFVHEAVHAQDLDKIGRLHWVERTRAIASFLR
jgi:hypothetical protein